MSGNTGESFEWSELVPGGVVVYYADGDEEILHVNQYVLDLFECADFSEFMAHTGGSFRGFVKSSDVDATERAIWSQVDKRGGFDHIYYQIRTRRDRIISVDDYGRLVQREGARPMFYAFVVEMERDDVIDWLTGLPGMERFFYMANAEAASVIERGDTSAMLVFDLMGMKLFNAINGRDEGDRLLRFFADILRRIFGTELCCRYAGDSFCVLTTTSDLDDRIRLVFDELAGAPDGGLPVMAGGCAIAAGEELSLVLDRAKVACDSDRATWESHISWYTEDMRDASLMRAYVLGHVDEAIKKGWIRPYYQGLVRTASGAVCGEEALARWIDPTYGFLSPAQFIPTLEEAGLLSNVDLHIIDCVLHDMAKKRDAGVPLVPVSVNVSLRDLGHVDLARRITRLANDLDIPHDLLCIEFTESAATSDPESLRFQIESLHAAGFRVWMDDFGSGFSSLNNLGSFDFDLIKLDMGFLYESEREKSRVIIDGVIRSAKRMGLRTLAEGVEKTGQAEALRDMGCDVQQGFLHFRPQSLDDVMANYLAHKSRLREPASERAYWDAVSSVSLADLSTGGEGNMVSEVPVAELPAGVVECRDGCWWILRENGPLRDILQTMGANPESISGDRQIYETPINIRGDEGFFAAIERARTSGTWERVSNLKNERLGFQFYVSLLATCDDAEAFLIQSAPNLLGAALGSYGDVPVGYAVLRVTANDQGTAAADAEYVYANEHYRNFGVFGKTDLTSKHIGDESDVGGAWLLPYCFRAAILHERVQEVVFSEKAGHWLTLSVVPSPITDCCIIAFMLADAEHFEHERMAVGLETSDFIIATADALNTERDYDSAMSNLLEAMSEVIHPDRLYIYERGEKTMSNTFEWCAEGVQPQIATLQNMRNEDFAVWDQMLSRKSVVLFEDVEALATVNPFMYEHLRRQGIDRMLAAPLFVGNELIGYLGADNYRLEESLDTHRLLKTVASFAGARIANQRLVAELEQLRTHDQLTGALNRRGVDEAIERQVSGHADEPFLLALVNVDDFRAMNDLYGRAVGDEALRVMVDTLERTFPHDSVIGRNGSGEALVALFGPRAAEARDELRALLDRGLTCCVEGRTYALPLSAGATWCASVADLASAYTRADEALYAVRISGDTGYREWDPGLGEWPLSSLVGFTTRDLAEHMPLAMVAHRVDGEILFANEGFARLLGYDSLANAIAGAGRNLAGVVDERDWERFAGSMQVAFAGDNPAKEYEFRVRVRTASGSALDVSYRARPVSMHERGNVIYAYLVARN